jgi:hypothetical protein
MMMDRVKLPPHIVKACKIAELTFDIEPKEYRAFQTELANKTLNQLKALGTVTDVVKVWNDRDGAMCGNKTTYAIVECDVNEFKKLRWCDTNQSFLVQHPGHRGAGFVRGITNVGPNGERER